MEDSAVLGKACERLPVAGAWVAAGVGSSAVVGGSVAGAFEGSGSACEVCDSAGAEGVGVGAAAAAGRRRAALGANFLPVVFSSHGLAESAPLHGTTHY